MIIRLLPIIGFLVIISVCCVMGYYIWYQSSKEIDSTKKVPMQANYDEFKYQAALMKQQVDNKAKRKPKKSYLRVVK